MSISSWPLLGGASGAPAVPPVVDPIHATTNYFKTKAGEVWAWRGHTAFLLFSHWLAGRPIDAQIAWYHQQGVNTVRVLGMVGWTGQAFGPQQSPGYWEELPAFVDALAAAGLRVEFVVFADAQIVMPHPADQREHLQRVLDVIGHKPNVFIEICNEPWQNGVEPTDIWEDDAPQPCPMAYGNYEDVPDLATLSYLTVHTQRDPDAWSRKAKDVLEYRDGPMGGGVHMPVIDDEPMGAAEAADLAGKQRSNIPDDFFWHHAVAHIFSAGSTFHSDPGLQAELPTPNGDVQKCADAATLAWTLIGPEWQTGQYTRGGLPDLPLVWDASYFPEQTSRIYGMILGSRAMCVAVKPNQGWVAQAVPGWRIVSAEGPRGTLVLLERDGAPQGRTWRRARWI